MRRSLAILGLLTARPDIRAVVAVASVIASGAATYWWCASSRRRQGLGHLVARLERGAGRARALAAVSNTLAGVHKTVLRGWLGPPQAAGDMGTIFNAPGVQVRRDAKQWYYRLPTAATAEAFGVLLVRFDGEGRVFSVGLIERSTT